MDWKGYDEGAVCFFYNKGGRRFVTVKAVLFDLFETLISEYEDGVRKVSRTERKEETLLGISLDVYRAEWSKRRDKRMTGVYADYAAVVRDIMVSQGLSWEERAVAELYANRIEEKKAAFTGKYSEVIAMLRALKERGVRLGLISNCTEEEVRGWQRSEFAPLFDEVLFSYEAGCAKPDEAVYRRACLNLGVLPQEALFIGDGGSDELSGAVRAGLTACQAVWFVPSYISDRITGFEKLQHPREVLSKLG